MGLYLTLATAVPGPDVNVTPFCQALHITMSGGITVGGADADLTEMPTRYPTWDLWPLVQVPGGHLRAWQDEGGSVVFRWFGGILVEASERAGDPESVYTRLYRITAQSYDVAALDATAVGQLSAGMPVFTIPAGTLASQIHYAAAQFNGGAGLVMDWTSRVENMTGSYSYPSLPVRNATFRQVLRALAARALAYDHSLVPRFCVDVDYATAPAAEFGPPYLYFYNAAASAPAAALTLNNVPTAGQHSTIGPVERRRVGRAPFATRAIGQNIGGWGVTVTAGAAAASPNPLNGVAATWDSVTLNMANPDPEMVGQVGALASAHSTAWDELHLATFGRCRPSLWATVIDSRLHAPYPTGALVNITDVSVDWTEKAFDTTIDGATVGNAVELRVVGSTRAPEVGDNPNAGPDLSLVVASAPAIPARNTVQSSQAGIDQITHLDRLSAVPHSWVDEWGNHHPVQQNLEYKTNTVRYTRFKFDLYNVQILSPSPLPGGMTVTATLGGVPTPFPIAHIPPHVQLAVTVAGAPVPLALLIGEVRP